MRILNSAFVISPVEDCSLGSQKLVFLKIFLNRAPFKGFHDPTFADPVRVLPVRSDPIRSDPIRSWFCQSDRSDPILVLLTVPQGELKHWSLLGVKGLNSIA